MPYCNTSNYACNKSENDNNISIYLRKISNDSSNKVIKHDNKNILANNTSIYVNNRYIKHDNSYISYASETIAKKP
jgi:hypothetical protein